jgi:hypothetical protein
MRVAYRVHKHNEWPNVNRERAISLTYEGSASPCVSGANGMTKSPITTPISAIVEGGWRGR